MKRLFYCLALLLIPTMMPAQQDIPAGMRMEISELELDDNEYSIFQYKDPDGTTAYYMSLGRVYKILGFFRDDITDMSFDHIDEVCIPLGNTKDEVIASLDDMLTLYDKAPGTTKEFPCRFTTGAERLGDSGTTMCTVVKRFLQGKRLSFQFVSGNRTAEADLRKSTVKNLKLNVKIENKLRPDNKEEK